MRHRAVLVVLVTLVLVLVGFLGVMLQHYDPAYIWVCFL